MITFTRNHSATASVKSSYGLNTWRAAMHINRKPGEQVKVAWAGDPATIIEPNTDDISKAYIFVGVMTNIQYAYVRILWWCHQNSHTEQLRDCS